MRQDLRRWSVVARRGAYDWLVRFGEIMWHFLFGLRREFAYNTIMLTGKEISNYDYTDSAPKLVLAGKVMMVSMRTPKRTSGDLTVREMAKLGGDARADSLTPEERTAIAKGGAAARWANATDEDRAELGRKLAAARAKARKAKAAAVKVVKKTGKSQEN